MNIFVVTGLWRTHQRACTDCQVNRHRAAQGLGTTHLAPQRNDFGELGKAGSLSPTKTPQHKAFKYNPWGNKKQSSTTLAPHPMIKSWTRPRAPVRVNDSKLDLLKAVCENNPCIWTLSTLIRCCGRWFCYWIQLDKTAASLHITSKHPAFHLSWQKCSEHLAHLPSGVSVWMHWLRRFPFTMSAFKSLQITLRS